MAKAKTGIPAIRQAIKDDPFDLEARLVLADALEEQGGMNDAAFQRLIVPFAQMIQDAVRVRGVLDPRHVVGVMDGPVNARIFTESRYRQATSGHRTVYGWVRRFCTADPIVSGALGEVWRGTWKKSEGPVRFYLTQGPEMWKKHVGPYGLAYLR